MPEQEGRLGNTAVLCFSPNDGGMEHDAAFMTQKISAYLGRCLLVIRKGAWLEGYAKRHGIPHAAVGFSGSFSIKAIREMRRLWRKHDIRNVIFLGASEIHSIHFSIGLPVRRFIVRHGTTKSSPKKDFVHRLTWSRVTAHWCISEHLKRNVMSLFPLENAEVFVDYVGLEGKLDYLPEASPLTAEESGLRLAHVGRLVPGKGQRDAIRAVKRAHEHGVPVTLTLFGGGGDQSYLEDLVKELGLEAVVSFAGYVAHPYQYFSDFHGFIYPSYGEGFGNAFAEALATGMHCFCYSNTVFPEFRKQGLRFHMVPNKDYRALADEVIGVWERREPQPRDNIELCRILFSTQHEMEVLRGYLD